MRLPYMSDLMNQQSRRWRERSKVQDLHVGAPHPHGHHEGASIEARDVRDENPGEIQAPRAEHTVGDCSLGRGSLRKLINTPEVVVAAPVKPVGLRLALPKKALALAAGGGGRAAKFAGEDLPTGKRCVCASKTKPPASYSSCSGCSSCSTAASCVDFRCWRRSCA